MTLRRISRWRMAVLAAFLAAHVDAQDTPAPASPPAEDQQKILNAMRTYAERYVSELPNFICDQVVRQFEAGKKSKRWREGDSLQYKLSFNGGRDTRTLQIVNNKPIDGAKRRWRAPLITQGEFGNKFARVFGEESQTAFEWAGWQAIGDKRLAAFNYSITKEHSALKLSKDYYTAVLGYHGSVYAEPESGVVWKITDTTSEIPKELETEEIQNTVEYDRIAVGSKAYMLPVRATALVILENQRIRNELEFKAYRKFETESTITFGGSEGGEGDTVQKPAPASQPPQKKP